MTKDPHTIQPLEPQGWFRWPHYHVFGGRRFGPGGGVATESMISRDSTALDSAFVARHAWEVGLNGRTDLLEENWHTLRPEQRGSAVAGLSETKDGMRWIPPRLASCMLDAVTTCELACNAVNQKRTDILAKVLNKSTCLTGEVQRYFAPGKRSWGEFSPVIERLSNRCIDLILEAAVVANNTSAIRLALDHGANADIPVWVLQRSYNEKHCALSFCIEHSMKKAVQLLLAAGANPKGTDFCTPNLPLFQAVATKNHTLALRLLRKGASFVASDAGNQRRGAIADEWKKKLITTPGKYSFGHGKKHLSWVHEKIGSLIKLVPVREKPCFYRGGGQGGYWRTFLDAAGSDVAVIQSYEAFGLDTRLTAEEFLSVVQSNAYDKLLHLLRNETEDVKGRVIFRVRRWQPDFGAEGPLALRPQEDRASEALGFDPGFQEPFTLPDGSELFVDLDAIARPDHPHGPCLKGHFWHLSEEPTLRRRGSRTVLKNLHPRWEMAEKPGNIHQLKHLLPVVRRFGGRFIRLGCTMGQLGFQTEDEKLASLIYQWDESPSFEQIADAAKRRIAAQDQSNLRPPAPVLTRDELDGYPKEFWPFLVRLPSGLIGMDENAVSAATFRIYRTWERENKREDTFVPDPRIVDHEVWTEVPPEMKPYLIWDNLFNRPGFSYSADTEYDRAMVRKATRWWNNFVMGRLQAIIPPLLEVIDEKGKEC